MLSDQEIEKYKKILNLNGYGLSNVIKSIAKNKNKEFVEIVASDLDEYVESQDSENLFWEKIKYICDENNYQGNYKYIFSTVSRMKDEKCHTDDKIQNVINYFKIMNYNKYLKENNLAELICNCCNKPFIDKPRTKYCPNCIVESVCHECGKPLGRFKIKNDDVKYYCDTCKGILSVKNNKKSGKCSICHIFNNERDQNGRGRDIIYGNGQKIKFEKLNKNKKKIYDLDFIPILPKSYLIGCQCSYNWYYGHNNSDQMKEQASNLGKKYGKENIIKYNKSPKHRIIAAKLGPRNGKNALIEYNKSEKHRLTAKKIGLKYGIHNLHAYPSFIKENNCKIHKNCNTMYYNRINKEYICWECYKERFKENNYNSNINNDNNKFQMILPKKLKCKQFGKIVEDPNDKFCSKECEKIYNENKSKYFKRNNNFGKHPDDILTYRKKCWSCYKEENFDNNIINLNSVNLFLTKIQKDYQNVYIQTTFRTQDSEDWTGASQAFEQDLIDKNISYFVYIKFYIKPIDKEYISIPIVVGKSGSKLVNENSDVNFSMNVNHGPARRFLNEEVLEWDKTKILIVPCESEKEAYRIEKEIHDKYNLFYS